jgi:hypothetical protein
MGEIDATARDAEQEAQRRRLCVHLRRLRALRNLLGLEAPDVVAGRRIRCAAEEFGKGLDMPDIIVPRLGAEVAVHHVLQHAAAKIADRLVTHRRLLS